MKVTKYLAIALAVVVILAWKTWLLRNSIIERLSGPTLAKYDVAVTGMSLMEARCCINYLRFACSI